MSRLLWLGNPPWVGSGYGEQAALFTPRLVDAGHELAGLCNYGLQGAPTTWNGITWYPSDGVWGNLALPVFADDHRAELVIALCDSWVLNAKHWPDGLEVASWVPIDHWPIPPKVLGALRQERVDEEAGTAQRQIRPIAMSRYGEQLMQEFELDPLYVPHGVDTRLFQPRPEIRGDVRDELGIPRDAFLVGMVAANKGNPNVHRKSFPQAFHAFAQFARRHDDAWLYAHTQATPMVGGGGMELDVLVEALHTFGGLPADRLRFPHNDVWLRGMPTAAISFLYQAFDVLLLPSMGEGFGVPLIEAQASGVPVITSRHSAMVELCGAGWLVDGDPFWDSAQHAWNTIPFVGSIVEALEGAYAARDDQTLRETAVAFAAQYDADVVFDEFWRPALEALLAPSDFAPSDEVAKPEEVAA